MPAAVGIVLEVDPGAEAVTRPEERRAVEESLERAMTSSPSERRSIGELEALV